MSTIALESADICSRLATVCGRDVLLDHAKTEEDGSWSGYKFVSAGEACFQGHFPGHPILPGVLQVEAMVQLGQVGALELTGRHLYLAGVSRVKFRKPVHPGDLLVVHLTFGEDGLSAVARTSVDGAVTCQANLVFTEVQPEPVCGPITPFVPDFEGEQLSVEQIMDVIPHRYPFLLVDRLFRETTEVEGEYGQVIGLKNVTAGECLFAAGRSVVASTLLLEMCAQAGCVWALEHPSNEGKIGYFMAIDKATFHRSVSPGAQLRIEMSELSLRGRIGQGHADIYAGDVLVASGFLKFAFVTVEA